MSNAPSHDESFRREIDARVGRTLSQRYTLEAVIAVDATAATYRGAHRNGNRVSVRVLHTELAASKETRERFLREAYDANRVEHPGALRISDDDTAEDGTVYFVTDLLEGQTLEDMLLKAGTLQPSELAPLMADVLDVLAAAHAKGVVHRALSPSTIFITQSRDGTSPASPERGRNQTVRVTDFGIGRIADGSHIHARLGRAMEASAYVAPEQARGELASVDAQTDLWAAGAVMFRALTGRFVYQAATPEMVKIQAATQPAPQVLTLVPQCEPNVAEIVDRALGWKKEERFRNATALATALRTGRPGSIQPPQLVTQAMPAMPSAPPPAAHQSVPPPGVHPSAPPGPHPSAQPPPANPFAGQQPQQAQQPPPPFGPNFMPVPASTTDNGWIKWVALAAALIVLFTVGAGALGFLAYRSARKTTADAGLGAKADLAWSDSESPVPVTSHDPVWGSREALVTVVVFSDFQCPFCSRVEPTLDQVRTTYGPDKVRIVWKNQPLPFHQNAKPTAEAAQVVFTLGGSDAFFKFHDLAFKNQGQLTPENFHLWAVSAGVDGNAFDTALSTRTASAKIEEDMALAKKVGANGTPAFRINGIELSGAQPFEKFKQVIDPELTKAAAKIATGTAQDRVYVVLSTENFKQAPAKKDDEEHEEDTAIWRVLVAGSPVRGNIDAPVTIVEFSDFQCPFCKRVGPTLDKVRERYGDKVRIVWKNEPLPFHPRAEPAAELALEARTQKGDAGFFRAHDALFESQPKLEDDDLLKIGAQLGLDAGKVKTAIRDKKHKAVIDADAALADDVKASGTPHFFINGRRMVGAQPFEKFQTVIDEELKKFESKRGSVAAKDYYASIMRDAQGTPEPEKKQAPPVPAGAPFRGGKNAKVVIQEWADFQCPFCARAQTTLDELQKEYGDRIKIVWRDKPLPFHQNAEPAAELAREALAERGPDAFWKMHAKLFANQQKLGREDLDGYAVDLGLDKSKVARALDGHTHKSVIDADDKLGTDIGISGTPAFLINNYYLSGAQPAAKFKKLIEKAFTEAR